MIMGFNKSTAFKRTAPNKTGWFVLVFYLLHLTSFGQTTDKYLVLLRDKANSPYSISRPEQFLSQRAVLRRQKQNIAVLERDLPVNPVYVSQLQQAGANVWFTSRWLNAVLVEASPTTIAAVRQLPFVTGLEFGGSLANARSSALSRIGSLPSGSRSSKFGEVTPLAYGPAETQINQIGADKMHQQGFQGEGMLIGVLDAGFLNANTVGFLKPLFDEKRVVATYDFVRKEAGVYEDDEHGTEVLSTMAASAANQLYGTAYKASYLLLRTEDAATERPIEEANWLFGAEYADSAGVDVINSSLGYYDFDPPYDDASHTYADLDGRTTLISRAAQWAAEAGMVVVNSAGNEGGNAWQRIIVPADAPGVLAIGGVDQTGFRWPLSSLGPSADGRVKPDLAARGTGVVVGLPNGRIAIGSGTSFASPLVAGLAAGFWQAHPNLTAAQVTEALRRSGNQYGSPDNLLGYGIPNFERASVLAEAYNKLLIYPNPFSEAEPLSIFWGDIEPNVPLEAMLTNAAGRVLWRGRYTTGASASFVLPNLGLSAGLYYMTLVAGDKKRTTKVVKR